MKTHKFLTPLICLCSALLLCVTVRAQDMNAYLYFVHGAPGRNVSAMTNPAFPVDVEVNSTCAVKAASFGDVVGPVVAPAGSFTIKVTPANTATPCSGTAVFQVTQSLTAATINFAVLGVNASQQVTGQFFQPDISSIPAGQSRVVIANVTDATLTTGLTGMAISATNSISNIAPNTAQTAVTPSGVYAGGVFISGTQNLVYGPTSVTLFSRNLYFYVLAGLTANSSVQLISKEIWNVL